jgi:membrane-associated phospholipid phosphatase
VRSRGWLADVVLLVLLAALTAALAAGALLDVDLAVRDWVDAHRPASAYVVARVPNYLGQGFVLIGLSVLAAVRLARREHSVRPLLPVAAAWLVLTLVVGPIKLLLDRAPPHRVDVPHPEELFSGGMSYPSGHVANAIVWYGVLVLLLAGGLPAAARVALRVGPPVIVAVVTTYLGFHWLTDTVAGILIGLLLDRLLRRVDWNAVPLERVPGGRRLAARGGTGPVRQMRPTLR